MLWLNSHNKTIGLDGTIKKRLDCFCTTRQCLPPFRVILISDDSVQCSQSNQNALISTISRVDGN